MHAPTQKTHHTAFLLLWQKSMTNNCLTTIEAVLSTWNQRRWFICSKRYQQPQREPSIAHSMSKNSTNWEQLFTTVNSYSTWIITVWKPDKATTTPGLQAVQLTDWFSKGDLLTGTGADGTVWVGTEDVGWACSDLFALVVFFVVVLLIFAI